MAMLLAPPAQSSDSPTRMAPTGSIIRVRPQPESQASILAYFALLAWKATKCGAAFTIRFSILMSMPPSAAPFR